MRSDASSSFSCGMEMLLLPVRWTPLVSLSRGGFGKGRLRVGSAAGQRQQRHYDPGSAHQRFLMFMLVSMTSVIQFGILNVLAPNYGPAAAVAQPAEQPKMKELLLTVAV